MGACRSNNICSLFFEQVEKHPDRTALKIPVSWPEGNFVSYDAITYKETGERVLAFMAGFRRQGLKPGDRVIIMFPPSADLYCLITAVIAYGAVVILIDNNMGARKVLQAIKSSRAEMIVSVQRLFRYRFLIPHMWKMKWFSADTCGLFVKPLHHLSIYGNQEETVYPCEKEHPSIIFFTSGSTGIPKGANRTHGLLMAQFEGHHIRLRKTREETELTSFLSMPLLGMCSGWTNVLPCMEFGKPESVDPSAVLTQINQDEITRIAVPPVIFDKLCTYLLEKKLAVPGMKKLITGGATVSPVLCRQMLEAFPGAEIEIFYGSTEAEPISRTSAREIIGFSGKGHLVGKPIEQITVSIVRLPDSHFFIEEGDLRPYEVPTGEVGEIVVKGDAVLKEYVDNPVATKENKIPCKDGLVWHRTGDTGYFGEQGRLFLSGRLKDIVRINGKDLHPYHYEKPIDDLSGGVRSALIAPDLNSPPILVVQFEKDLGKDSVSDAVRIFLKREGLGDIGIREIDSMPLDYRHNSKIDRPLLRRIFFKT